MKHLFLLLVLAVWTTALSAQATASTNQTIAAQGISTLQLDLFSPNVEVRETKGSRLIVEAHITVEGITNVSLLEYVVKAGRYELQTQADASTQTLTLTRKVHNKVLMAAGKECTEHIRYVVLVPSSIKNVETNTAQTPVE